MTRHLLSLGHRRLVFLLDRSDPEDLRQVAAGCRRAVLEWGGGADGRVLLTENSIQGGFVAAERLLQSGPPPGCPAL